MGTFVLSILVLIKMLISVGIHVLSILVLIKMLSIRGYPCTQYPSTD